jgi:hypothetical protein
MVRKDAFHFSPILDRSCLNLTVAIMESHSMTLRTKIKFANVVCIVSFVLSVIILFIYPYVSNLFFVLGIISGFRAAKWGKQMRLEEGQNAKSAHLPIRNSLGRKLTWGWLLFYIPLSAILLLLGSARLWEWHLFRDHSVEASGFVTAKEKADTGLNPYHLTYYYYAEDGKRYEHREEVNTGTWYSLNEGDSVSVKYLPRRPWNSRLDFENEERNEGGAAFFEFCIGIVIFLWGTWAFFYYLKKFR